MGKSIQALSLSYRSLARSSDIHSFPLMCPSASFFKCIEKCIWLQLSFHSFPLKTIVSISLLQISELAGCSHLELLFLDCDKWATSQHFLPFRLQGHHLTCPKLHLLFPWLVKVLPIFVTICIVEAYQSMASLQDFFCQPQGAKRSLNALQQPLPLLSRNSLSSIRGSCFLLKSSSFGCETFLTLGALGDFLYRKFLYQSCSYHSKTSPSFILQSQLPLCSLQVFLLDF